MVSRMRSRQGQGISKRSSKQGDPFYVSPEWRRVRDKRLKADRYICQECGVVCLGKRRNKPAPQVDHIKPRKTHPALELDMDNLRTLCHPCHSKRTRADQLDRPEIGPDGYLV